MSSGEDELERSPETLSREEPQHEFSFLWLAEKQRMPCEAAISYFSVRDLALMKQRRM